jgi:hypothetical protein
MPSPGLAKLAGLRIESHIPPMDAFKQWGWTVDRNKPLEISGSCFTCHAALSSTRLQRQRQPKYGKGHDAGKHLIKVSCHPCRQEYRYEVDR